MEQNGIIYIECFAQDTGKGNLSSWMTENVIALLEKFVPFTHDAKLGQPLKILGLRGLFW